MSKQSFADLGVSSAVSGALSRRGITAALPRPAARHRRRARRPRRARQVPDRLGQDARLRHPARRAHRRQRAGPGRRSCSRPPASSRRRSSTELEDLAAARGLRVAAVYGGVGIAHQAAQAPKRSHILVATPGRLEDLLAARAFTLDAIRILVLDEADRMLDMGFRPAIDRIVAACPARAPDAVLLGHARRRRRRVAGRYTHRRDRARARRARAQTTLTRSSTASSTFATRTACEALVDELAGERDLALVFVRTKRGADRLVKRLGAQRRRGGRDPRQQVPAPARAGARALSVRARRHARRDRRRRARHRRRRHLARDQLRPARRPRHLRPPRRAHRPRRTDGHRHHARRARPSARRCASWHGSSGWDGTRGRPPTPAGPPAARAPGAARGARGAAAGARSSQPASPESVGRWGLRSLVDRLQLQVGREALGAELAPEAARLHAAERRGGVEHVVVDADAAGLHAPGDVLRALGVAASTRCRRARIRSRWRSRRRRSTPS